MKRRGLTDYKDRFFGAIVYLFALRDAVALGSILLLTIPALSPIISPFMDLLFILIIPVNLIYGIVGTAIPGGFGSLLIFFVLIIAVVQNDRISYFIRFNTMQSILIGIALSLILIVSDALRVLGLIGGFIFLIAAPVCLYCMVQCALGKYPEIPSFSKFAYDQVRR